MNTQGNRSLLLPLLLILGGGIWLLNEANIVSGANIAMLFRLVPFILIVLGIELVIRGRYPRAAMYLGIGSAVVLLALVLVGPSLGWVSSREVQSGSYEDPLNDATSAEVNVGISVGEVNVTTLTDSSNLFEADISYVGRVEFFQRGEAERFVSLQQTESGNGNFDFGDLFNFWDIRIDQVVWNIGIAPEVPINLDVNAGVGRADLNLADVNLTRLSVNAGVGEVIATLPATDASYEAVFSGGTGSMEITVPEGAAVELRVSGGVGGTTIDVPDGASVTLDASTGLGGVDVPAGYTLTSGNDNDGVWQSGDYNNDARQITIHYEGGVGGLTVR
ncbi:MAG: hypothetical protein U0694_19120 [Anaerolineae bacterium]